MSEIRNKIAFAISDPGQAGEGYKGDRTLTEWQTDAVMRIVFELEKASVAYVNANTALIATLAAKDAKIARLRESLAKDEVRFNDAANRAVSAMTGIQKAEFADHLLRCSYECTAALSTPQTDGGDNAL